MSAANRGAVRKEHDFYPTPAPAFESKALIHLASVDQWVEHTVVGYYVWADLKGDPRLHRVFVRVVNTDGYENARMLCDVRRLDDQPSAREDARA